MKPPKKTKSQDGDSHSGMLRTTFVCPAIHCPSCVSFLQSSLSSIPFRVPIPSTSGKSYSSPIYLQDITVSHFDQTISFSHPKRNDSTTTTTRDDKAIDDRSFTIALLRQVMTSLKKDSYSVDSVHCRDLMSSNPSHTSFVIDPENEEQEMETSREGENARDEATRALLIPELSRKDKYKNYGSTSNSHQNDASKTVVGSYPPPELQTGFLASLDRFIHSEKARKEDELRKRYERHLQVCEACQSGKGHDEPAEATEERVQCRGEWEVQFAIGGMTCAACVSNVVSATENVPLNGEKLISFDVNLLSSSARAVITSESLVALLVEAIEDSGYEAEVISSKSLGQDESTSSLQSGPNTFIAKFSVGGMTCSSCVGNISQAVEAFRKPENVESFEVALLESAATAILKADDQESALAFANKLLEAIEDCGYEAQLASLQEKTPLNASRSKKATESRRTVRIRIEGMFCEHCIHKVRSHLQSMSKDRNIKFSISESNLSGLSLSAPEFECSYSAVPVGTEDQILTLRTILSSLEALDPAFSAEFVAPPSLGNRSSYLARKEFRGLLARLVISFIFVIPTLIVGMVAPILDHQHPLNEFLDKAILGGATRSELILWMLATPVEFGVGLVFWKRSWKGIRNVWRKERSWGDRIWRWGDMNVLVSLGTGVAYFSSLAFLMVDIKRGQPKKGEMTDSMGMTYFDACVFLIFFILLGRVLESWSKSRTGDAVSELGGLKPTHGLLLLDPSNPTSSDTSSTPVDLLEIGDLVLIPSGSSPPLDSSLSPSNSSSLEVLLNEASLTGESRPAKKKVNEILNVGTVNVSSSPVIARIEVLSGQNMLDEILEVVRDASGKKANIERLADKITGIFVPILVVIAVLVLSVWLILLYSGFISEHWFEKNAPYPSQPGSRVLYAIQFAVSVLVIACPCGIGLAAPTAQMCGIGVASKLGVLVNGGGSAFEEASKAASGKKELFVLFDKTGTLTEGGEGQVVDHATFPSDLEEETLWNCVSIVEKQSTHPAAATLQAFCSQRGIKSSDTENLEEPTSKTPTLSLERVEEISGMGMKATILSKSNSGTASKIELYIGNQRLLTEAKVPALSDSTSSLTRDWQSQARSVVYVAARVSSTSSTDQTPPSLQAALAVADAIRKESAQTIRILKERFGAQVWMVSGDNEITAKAVGRQVGIEEQNIVAGVLPKGKLEWVQRIRAGGEENKGNLNSSSSSNRTILFVGDGINDSPSLAEADLSFAMGSGSSIAHSSASFVLLARSSPLLSIPILLSLSVSTQKTIVMNFLWALLFNLSLVPIAAGGLAFAGVQIGPSISGLAMALSSTTVVLNALTLRLWTPPKDMR